MSRLLEIHSEEFEEGFLDVDLVVTFGVATITVKTLLGTTSNRACIATTSAGQRIILPEDHYKKILSLKLQRDPDDLEIPDAFLKGWVDPKGDDEEGLDKAEA
jgi:hypothetical protein